MMGAGPALQIINLAIGCIGYPKTGPPKIFIGWFNMAVPPVFEINVATLIATIYQIHLICQ
jgi:hypothetical protein